jgi:hypothetical protein
MERVPVIPAKLVLDSIREPESRKFNVFWMPDQVRHDDFETFYGIAFNAI